MFPVLVDEAVAVVPREGWVENQAAVAQWEVRVVVREVGSVHRARSTLQTWQLVRCRW